MERQVFFKDGHMFVRYSKEYFTKSAAWEHLLSNTPDGVALPSPRIVFSKACPYRKQHTDSHWMWKVVYFYAKPDVLTNTEPDRPVDQLPVGEFFTHVQSGALTMVRIHNTATDEVTYSRHGYVFTDLYDKFTETHTPATPLDIKKWAQRQFYEATPDDE